MSIYIKTANGGTALDFLVEDEKVLAKMQMWRHGIYVEFGYDKNGKPIDIIIRKAKKGKPGFKLEHCCDGMFFRVPFPKRLRADMGPDTEPHTEH
jgi:hypothetical protein